MDIRPVGNVTQSGPSPAEKQVQGAQAVVAVKTAVASVETAAAVPQPGAIPSLAQLAQAVKSINKSFAEQSQDLEFSIDSDSNRTIIKVVDQKTKEVLRQIPGEEVLQIAKALDMAQQGLLIKQKA